MAGVAVTRSSGSKVAPAAMASPPGTAPPCCFVSCSTMHEKSSWSGLPLDVLLKVIAGLQGADRKAAHLVSRSFRDATCLSLTHLCLRHTLDTARLRASFPNVASLHLCCLSLSPRDMLCLASLDRQLTALRLSRCTVTSGASVLALAQLHRLVQLELLDVVGPSAEALDDALLHMTALQTLTVDNRTPHSRAPTLKSLARLPRMRRLSVRQAAPRQALHLHTLTALRDLSSLEFRGAGVTNHVMHCLSSLTGLTQLLIPDAHRVTDDGLDFLAPLSRLQTLDLSCSLPQFDDAVTDAGIASLSDCCELTSLSLAGRGGVTASSLQFLGACCDLRSLDLSRVQLGGGGTCFLWKLTQLTSLSLRATGMQAQQFCGLAALTGLRRLDVSHTGFDDGACPHLSALTALSALAMRNVSGQLSNAGLEALHGQCRQLAVLCFEGCRITTLGVRRALAAHPQARMWHPSRDHLPRWLNKLHLQLVAYPAPGQRCLRLRHAPEPTRWQQAQVVAWAAGLMAAHALLVLLLAIAALTLPLAVLAAGAWLAVASLVCRGGRRRAFACVQQGWVRVEALMVGLAVGLHSPVVPPPALLPEV